MSTWVYIFTSIFYPEEKRDALWVLLLSSLFTSSLFLDHLFPSLTSCSHCFSGVVIKKIHEQKQHRRGQGLFQLILLRNSPLQWEVRAEAQDRNQEQALPRNSTYWSLLEVFNLAQSHLLWDGATSRDGPTHSGLVLFTSINRQVNPLRYGHWPTWWRQFNWYSFPGDYRIC